MPGLRNVKTTDGAPCLCPMVAAGVGLRADVVRVYFSYMSVEQTSWCFKKELVVGGIFKPRKTSTKRHDW